MCGDMAAEPSRELVLKKLRASFGSAERAAEALVSLDRYGIEAWHRERERVQLAILKQCDGDLGRLRKLVELASSDYRDVLVGAEYPEQFAAPFNTPPAEMAIIRKRDREQYEAWLRSDTP